MWAADVRYSRARADRAWSTVVEENGARRMSVSWTRKLRRLGRSAAMVAILVVGLRSRTTMNHMAMALVQKPLRSGQGP